MINAESFTYNQVSDDFGGLNFSPYLPLTLSYGNNSIETSGLLDTGVRYNVMPYQIGLQLGARWEQQNTVVQLAGNLANLPAYGLLITATIAQFPPRKGARLDFLCELWCLQNNPSLAPFFFYFYKIIRAWPLFSSIKFTQFDNTVLVGIGGLAIFG